MRFSPFETGWKKARENLIYKKNRSYVSDSNIIFHLGSPRALKSSILKCVSVFWLLNTVYKENKIKMVYIKISSKAYNQKNIQIGLK